MARITLAVEIARELRSGNKMKSSGPKVHFVVRESWSECPSESEYILCSPRDGYMDPKATENEKSVTCKRCLKILDKEKKPHPRGSDHG